MDIIISAVICTHNRDKYIGKAIASLIDQTLDKDSYEIIVVDNRSTDNTASIIKEMESTSTNIKYILEENLGLSIARNTGWQNARGRYIAFLDDDAAASPSWLARIVECFETGDESVAEVGGRVDPIWQTPPPSWLTTPLKHSLALVDWGDSPKVLPPDQWLAGVNVAYRRTILEKFNGFCTALGRKGKKLLSMEEILLKDQLAAMGFKSYYDPRIFVRHHIPASRLTRGWFFKRYFWQGVSEARCQLLVTPANAAYYKRLKRALSYSRTFFFSPGSPRGFELTCFSVRKIGYITGLLSKQENPGPAITRN
jgi:glycosyltransferase involved in cell wall biosynthesis